MTLTEGSRSCESEYRLKSTSLPQNQTDMQSYSHFEILSVNGFRLPTSLVNTYSNSVWVLNYWHLNEYADAVRVWWCKRVTSQRWDLQQFRSEQLLFWDKNRFEVCCHAMSAFSIMLCVFNLLWSYCVACVPLIDIVREAVFSVPRGGSEISSVHVSFISTLVHQICWDWGWINALLLIQAALVKESHILISYSQKMK